MIAGIAYRCDRTSLSDLGHRRISLTPGLVRAVVSAPVLQVQVRNTTGVPADEGDRIVVAGDEVTDVEIRLHLDTFDVGRAVPLFKARIPADIITFRNHYAPSSDGQRFLVDSADDHEPINVVVNWTALISTR